MNALGIISCASFFVFLIGLDLLANWLLAKRSGWRRLRRRYPAHGQAGGRRFASPTVSVNGRLYRDRVNVSIGPAGLGIGVAPWSRPFHPRVMVPWDDISLGEMSDDGLLPLQVGDSASIVLSGRAAAAMERMMEDRRSRRWRQTQR